MENHKHLQPFSGIEKLQIEDDNHMLKFRNVARAEVYTYVGLIKDWLKLIHRQIKSRKEEAYLLQLQFHYITYRLDHKIYDLQSLRQEKLSIIFDEYKAFQAELSIACMIEMINRSLQCSQISECWTIL
ncbi:unnamed protein product [Paramecium octaurelia]|uniref:Uncharacterized protein n=1 Tax=Paramecium octaurelia TaxID=43137 RepID=A0A8S1SMX8_PAROT|nr:unnamed protein product [Paramecium octaurelia]